MKLPWKKVVDTSTLKTCKHKNIEVQILTESEPTLEVNKEESQSSKAAEIAINKRVKRLHDKQVQATIEGKTLVKIAKTMEAQASNVDGFIVQEIQEMDVQDPKEAAVTQTNVRNKKIQVTTETKAPIKSAKNIEIPNPRLRETLTQWGKIEKQAPKEGEIEVESNKSQASKVACPPEDK